MLGCFESIAAFGDIHHGAAHGRYCFSLHGERVFFQRQPQFAEVGIDQYSAVRDDVFPISELCIAGDLFAIPEYVIASIKDRIDACPLEYIDDRLIEVYIVIDVAILMSRHKSKAEIALVVIDRATA